MNHLAPLLTLETVRIDLDVVSRKRLLEEAGLMFETAYGIAHTEAFEALLAREKLGSTCVGAGCAIPHGRIDELKEPALVFLRTKEPLMLDAPDGRGVNLFLALLVPTEGSEEYLAILREMASIFSDKTMRTRLKDADSEVAICEIIHAWLPPDDLHIDRSYEDDQDDTPPSADAPNT